MVRNFMSTNRTTLTRAVVITGTSSGIGEACALHLAQRGFRVFAGVRREEDGARLKQQASGHLTPVLIDITDATSIAAAAETVGGAAGELGLVGLVNNAGIAVAGPLEFLPIDRLRQQFEVNVFGHVAVIQAFLPLLRKGRGRIINIGSIGGRMSFPFSGAYTASKFAMEALTDSLRMELQPWGIAVSILEPGSVPTPGWEKSRIAGERLLEELPQQAREYYGPAMNALAETAKKIAKGAVSPPQAVAKVVEQALTSRRPKTRYLVGIDARIQAMLAKALPDRLRDKLIIQRLGLPKEVKRN